MLIGIDASRGFLKNRTGVEEYSYQLIRALAKIDEKNQYILYLNGAENITMAGKLDWPENFKLKNIPFLRLWVHIALCRAAWQDKLDVLFIPAQAMPIFYLRKVVVTLHGLEYEHYPESYSAWRRFYLRLTTKFSLKHAAKIIAVSENTKKDLIKMYNGDTEKIKMVYHGFNAPTPTPSPPAIASLRRKRAGTFPSGRGSEFPLLSKEGRGEVLAPFLLAIGRLEKRKNIIGLIKAFELIKKDGWIGKLVLIGKPGYGYSEIKKAIQDSPYKEDIIEKGYVSNEEKWRILQSATVFVFPSFYEGFGMPLLEAFAARVPVAASNASSLPEVGGDACVYFNPENIDDMARKIKEVLENENLRQDLIQKCRTRLQNFSWEKCARETLEVIKNAT